MRRLLLLRPEPGLSASVERARALGLDPIACPLFEVGPVAWHVPDPAGFDALLLTSANAVRHAGPGLGRLAALPVHAVGAATAEAAAGAGLKVATVGSADLDQLLGLIPPGVRLLHLAGEHHRDSSDPRIERHIVYRSATLGDPGLPPLDSLVVAVHSPRAGRRLSELAGSRQEARVAAISSNAAVACGAGWAAVEVAAEPNDKCLLALAARLCQTSSPQ